MTSGLISAMGHISLRTTDIAASLHDAQDVLGLRVTERAGATTYLAASAVHHELRYIESDSDGVDSLGLIARDGAAFKEIRRRIEAEGMPILRHKPKAAGLQDSFSFVGPEGFVFEIVLEVQPDRPSALSFGPNRYGHFNFHPTDPTNMKNFLERVLEFRVSDVIGENYGYFMRCNSEHHGIAIIRGGGTLHHHAWEAQSVAELTKLGDRLHLLGRQLIWGPVRHGAGNNIAAYYVEHTGSVVELYTDIDHIYSEHRAPVHWLENEVWYNQWSDYVPDGFRKIGVPPAKAVDGTV
jgi:catechol 2,3-dioxygenase